MYHNVHYDCDKKECDIRSSYIRVDGKWTKIGYYNTGCKTFDVLNPSQEEKEHEILEKIDDFNAKVKQIREESKNKLKEMRESMDKENTHFSHLQNGFFK